MNQLHLLREAVLARAAARRARLELAEAFPALTAAQKQVLGFHLTMLAHNPREVCQADLDSLNAMLEYAK